MEVVKRNGSIVEFDKEKIYNAILKAMKNGSGIVKANIAYSIPEDIEKELISSKKERVDITEIETMVFEMLITKKQKITAKAYEAYRAVQEFKRNKTELDKKIEGIVDGSDLDIITENSNKNSTIASTQRDLIAGEYSKYYSRRVLLPDNILHAHDEGIIHMHDLDYFIEHIHNCFDGNMRFITSEGVKSFNECTNNQQVEIIDKNGMWRPAIVKNYGKQKMQIVTLTSGRTIKKIKCTRDHRWILKNDSVTTNLQIGDRLSLLQNTQNFDSVNPKMFCLGFVLGDGTDYHKKTCEGVQVRLCNNKTQYLDMFTKAGYSISTQQFSNGDIILTKNGDAFKQIFLSSHSWKFMSKNDLISLFNGYYAADGNQDRNGISTSNADLAQMIRDISSIAGYFIASEKFEIRDTNFKKNAQLYSFKFLKSQPSNRNWIVKEIKKTDNSKYDAWCIEEPVTHSFTLDGGIVTGNCCLVNLDDMLQNGTVINRKLIEKPRSLQTACTVATQIVQQVANGQYGGQTISLAHLAPFVRISHDKLIAKYLDRGLDQISAEIFAAEDLKEEVRAGMQTIQYQINTFSTCNGQAPFLSIYMHISEQPEYEKETAMLIEEALRQRIIGMKNEAGAYITPAFPKLLYVTDENNIYPGSPYYYLTELAAECVSKRMMPDFISAKKMREEHDGEVFPCMGCVEQNEIITYKYKDSLYVESFVRMWNRLRQDFKVQHQGSKDNPNLYMDLSGVEIYDSSKNKLITTERIIQNVNQNNWVMIKISDGRMITCTKDHPFPTARGRVLAEDLKIDDIITINKSQYFEEGLACDWNEDLAWAYGVLLLKANLAKTPTVFFPESSQISAALVTTINNHYDTYCETKHNEEDDYKEIIFTSEELQRDLIMLFGGIKKIDRQIPNQVFSMSEKVRMKFLAGMIDAVGHVKAGKDQNEASLKTINKEIALQTMALMQSLDMSASIKEKEMLDFKIPKYKVKCELSIELLKAMLCVNFKGNLADFAFNGDSALKRKPQTLKDGRIMSIKNTYVEGYSYDVTTESDYFDVSGILSHNCRSFLGLYKDDDGKYKWYGRFNQGRQLCPLSA